LHSLETENTALTATNPTDSPEETKTTEQRKLLSMENYFDVPKILAGEETGVKIIGGPSAP